MISLQNVAKTFLTKDGTPVPAVKGVSLTVAKGEFVILTGRSGSGKTTLLNLAAGLTRPTAGEVHIGDANLWTLSDRDQSQLRNRTVGFIFQFPSLLPSLSVIENVLLPLSFRSNGTSGAAQRARELLATVGLAEKMGAYPRQLSAGQQQRVVIARSLINRPEVLLADEPTSNLDEQTEREIMGMLREIHASTAVTILLVTHTSQLIPYGTRALEMMDGTIRAEALPV
ncbi:MAG: ABC-type antimicrobial peptide transport system, ATPase component [candidate division NC10 bacterium]|nr:ABC-type antimicrobial peptide transport system, ATPase component [candidate division NC10 bacterium]